jgi:hypothetical protein
MKADRTVLWAGLLSLSVLPIAAATAGNAPVCGKCHPAETEAFLKSPMGRSIAPPSRLPSGRVTHKPSGSVITIAERGSRMLHTLSAGGLSETHPIAYQIGSGKIGYTYMVQIDSYLFESPVSWYTRHGWDLSPGYGRDPQVGFNRLMDAACLYCHAANAKFLDAEGRRFSGVTLQPISCERCHGPTSEHVRNPSPDNIINPSKLPHRARNSICEQCHLEGAMRVLNPGKTWQDFHPGDEFERTAAVYLPAQKDHGTGAVAQVEQLALSQCVRGSGGKLWCASCHNPHKQVLDRNREVRAVCVSCHTVLSKTAHPSPPAECVSCHMPRLTPNDIPHTASTDHRIVRRPIPLPGGGGDAAPALTVWQEPPLPFRERDQAMADVRVGLQRRIPALRDEGFKLLEALPAAQRDNDPEVLAAMASVNLQRGMPQQALEYARLAVEKEPASARAALNLALTFLQMGQAAKAEPELLRAIDLDRSLETAWVDLAMLYQQEGRRDDTMSVVGRYLKWNPQSIAFQIQKAILSRQR